MSRKRDEPIIMSLLDLDFYKLVMGWFIHRYYPEVRVTFGMKNRTQQFKLPIYIDIGELREQLDHVRTLRFNQSELFWMRGMNVYGDHMFPETYLDLLRNLELPEYQLSQRGDEFDLTFTGPWQTVTYWETIALSIVNELFYRGVMRDLSRFERQAIYAGGTHRLDKKIKQLKQLPRIRFIEFGTRRRFGRVWQADVTRVLAEELPDQFRGTSNARLAFDHGYMPMGTNAHELQMVAAALAQTDDGLRESVMMVCDRWFALYGTGLSVALTDTFGSSHFFKSFGPERAAEWKGMRQDSGDPFVFGRQLVEWYRGHGIDPKTKLLIPSDGLDLEKIKALDAEFGDQINVSYGWGTTLTNDVGLPTLSLVAKAIEANGRPTVKLSDNLAKAMGPAQEIERYRRVFNYQNTFVEECTV